jgi:hypothetical protein
MRHALIKNCCPACGGALLGDLHVQRLELMKQRILQQEFSARIDSDLIFDLSMFLLMEFYPERLEASKEDSTYEEEDLEYEEISGEVVMEETYESIRDQVRSEVLSEEEFQENPDDLKVARLKRIAKEKKVNNPGAIVRRISD